MPGLLAMTAERRAISSEPRITLSPYRINTASPLVGIKSCNYLEKILARNEAAERGFDECIQLNERGEVASASMANVFWAKDGILFTPSLKTGCLAGTTREFVIESLECREIEVGIEALRSADEVFLTSAGIGVAHVSKFEGRAFERRKHPIRELLPFVTRA
jgi:branched-subunit amino acid aminotransferase/4-amino-4-deoxychorismate lyase